MLALLLAVRRNEEEITNPRPLFLQRIYNSRLHTHALSGESKRAKEGAGGGKRVNWVELIKSCAHFYSIDRNEPIIQFYFTGWIFLPFILQKRRQMEF